MSDVIKDRLKESQGKDIKLFLKNGFYYFGKLVNFDEIYLEILDYKTSSYIIKKLCDVQNIEVKA